MTGITTSGVGSGIDINKIVTDLINAEKAPATKRLDNKEAKLQEQLSAVGLFKSAVSDFRSALAGVGSVTKFQNLNATSSNDTLLSASTTSVAKAGSYSVGVTQLAQAQKLVTSADHRFTNTTDVVGTGTLTFSFGTTAGGTGTPATPITFTDNPAKTAKTITIDSSNNTLDGLRNAINDANIGVRANIIHDGEGYRLTLGVTDSGAANSLKITTTDGDSNNTDQAGLSLLSYDPTATLNAGKNLTETTKAQNAQLTVDGLAISSASNTVVGAVPGVTLRLKSAQTDPLAAPATLTVAQDSATASKAVDAFVTAYNALMTTSKSLTVFNAKTGEKGPLLGDTNVRSITSQIRNIFTGSVSGSTGTLHTLSDIGVGLQRDGTLGLDSSKLQAALTADPQGVAGLFSRVSRTSDPLISTSGGSTSTAGVYAVNITALATQAQYAAAAPTALTIGANNDSFQIKINGTNSNAINLTQKTYATGAELAVELQTQINADSLLQGAGVSVSVSYDADNRRMMFASNGGSDPSVEFTAVDTKTAATLGFNLGGGSPTYTAATPSAITIGADNNSFALTVNGKAASAVITLNQGTYTGTELATELQSKINADSRLAGVSATLAVSYQSSTNRFSFRSNAYGSASSIEFTSASASMQATLGISIGQLVTGQDVAGTIGGVDATGVERKLTAAGSAVGLGVEVLGGATGPRGTLSLTDGIAPRLDSLLGNFLGSGGVLSTRTDSINQQIAQIGTQRTTLNSHMTSLEARYRAQFLAMDTLVSKLTATGNYLTQQFNNNSSSSN